MQEEEYTWPLGRMGRSVEDGGFSKCVVLVLSLFGIEFCDGNFKEEAEMSRLHRVLI